MLKIIDTVIKVAKKWGDPSSWQEVAVDINGKFIKTLQKLEDVTDKEELNKRVIEVYKQYAKHFGFLEISLVRYQNLPKLFLEEQQGWNHYIRSAINSQKAPIYISFLLVETTHIVAYNQRNIRNTGEPKDHDKLPEFAISGKVVKSPCNTIVFPWVFHKIIEQMGWVEQAIPQLIYQE